MEGIIMREAKFKRQLTITLSPEQYELVKQETDAGKISLSEWFRDAVVIKLKSDQIKNREDQNNE
jgi:hypothetical protein